MKSSALRSDAEKAAFPSKGVSAAGPAAANLVWSRLARGGGWLQPRLRVGAVDDPLEREADRVADAVVSGSVSGSLSGSAAGTVQRKCSAWEEEEMLQAKGAAGPRGSTPEVSPTTASRIASFRGGGEALSPAAQSYFEPRFGRDLSAVRLHTSGEAATAAQEVQARAFTVGSDIAFAAGEYRPESSEGRRLLAHELTHTVQQEGRDARLRRTPDDPPAPSPSPGPTTPPAPPVPALAPAPALKVPAFKGKVEMTFDGTNLTITDGGSVVAILSATSGRPTEVDPADVTACGGKAGEVYVNNPRYVGIKDRGAIPEGTYSIRPKGLMEFSEDEQVDLLEGGARQKKSVKIRGTALHPGDWGRGRIELHAKKVLAGLTGCGNTAKRSDFFLHGGVLRGSAGCIDIGSNMDDLAAQLRVYKSDIPVTVAYGTGAGATLTGCELILGELFYKGTMNPGLLACLPGLTSSGDPEADAVWNKLIAKLTAGGLTLPGSSPTPGTPPTGGSLLDTLKDLWPF